MKYTYDYAQIRAAAKFILKHNPSAYRWNVTEDFLVDEIIGYCRESAQRLKERCAGNKYDVTFMTTGGYWILAKGTSEKVDVDVLVNPNIAHSKYDPTEVQI